MNMWTSPSGQPEPFGTCGQGGGQHLIVLPTALPTLSGFLPTNSQAQQQVIFISILGGASRQCYLKICPTNRTVRVLVKPDILACY